MDLDPMMNTSQDENIYSNYDNRPIRPMDQDALNEALARLPILVDEDDAMSISDGNTSTKSRRQPVLAYSTRRKEFSGVNVNQSVLNMTATPINNKRKLGGCSSMNKLIKQLDSRQDIVQLKEENKILEDGKSNLQLECVLLKKSHQAESELLQQEDQQMIDTLVQEHNVQLEQLGASLVDKEQLLVQTNLELDNLRNDHTMLLLEKQTLDKIVTEYELIKQEMNTKLMENETTIENLREEIQNMIRIQQQKLSTSKSNLANGRMPLKETLTDRSRIVNRPKLNARGLISPSSSISTSLDKSACPSISTGKPVLSKSKFKSNVVVDDKKKSISTDKHLNQTSARMKSKLVIKK